VKPRLRDDAEEGSKQAARTTLVLVFDGILRLLHPLIPFVTEELWQKLPWPEGEERPEALISAPWPTPGPARNDPEAEAQMVAVQELITQVRRLRKEYGVPEGAEVAAFVRRAPASFEIALAAEDSSIRRLARVNALWVGDGVGTGMSEGAVAGAAGGKGAHAILRNGAELFMPLEGVIDLGKERERISVEIQRLSGQLKGIKGKLENRNFLERAPEEVVAREREKEASFREQMEKLQEKLKVFEGA
jgi:valyl-tRNA synthetase